MKLRRSFFMVYSPSPILLLLPIFIPSLSYTFFCSYFVEIVYMYQWYQCVCVVLFCLLWFFCFCCCFSDGVVSGGDGGVVWIWISLLIIDALSISFLRILIHSIMLSLFRISPSTKVISSSSCNGACCCYVFCFHFLLIKKSNAISFYLSMSVCWCIKNFIFNSLYPLHNATLPSSPTTILSHTHLT